MFGFTEPGTAIEFGFFVDLLIGLVFTVKNRVTFINSIYWLFFFTELKIIGLDRG
jgi:hypothetical protein